MEHTPGPWTIWNEQLELDPEYATGPPLIIAPGEDESVTICEVNADCDEYVANAKAIIAIPELVKACEGLLELLPECECDNTHEANNTVCRICWAKNALAKARQTN